MVVPELPQVEVFEIESEMPRGLSCWNVVIEEVGAQRCRFLSPLALRTPEPMPGGWPDSSSEKEPRAHELARQFLLSAG